MCANKYSHHLCLGLKVATVGNGSNWLCVTEGNCIFTDASIRSDASAFMSLDSNPVALYRLPRVLTVRPTQICYGTFKLNFTLYTMS